MSAFAFVASRPRIRMVNPVPYTDRIVGAVRCISSSANRVRMLVADLIDGELYYTFSLLTHGLVFDQNH
jgi:hypothetical protein